MAVGNKLAQIIKEKGLTQKEVAEKAGVQPQTLNKMITRDSARADIQLLLKICKVLDVPVSIFAEDAIEEFYEDHPKAKMIESTPSIELNDKQKKLLALFDQLDEVQQDMILDRAEMLAEENIRRVEQKESG